MLKILKHCLAVAIMVATVATPVATLVNSGVKDVMDEVKSILESMIQAVDMSINFREQQLGDGATDDLSGSETGGQNAKDIFESLAALEGADLRRLDTSLWDND